MLCWQKVTVYWEKGLPELRAETNCGHCYVMNVFFMEVSPCSARRSPDGVTARVHWMPEHFCSSAKQVIHKQ